jgi:hypothetical protein
LTAAITSHFSDSASIVLDSLIHLLRVITGREISALPEPPSRFHGPELNKLEVSRTPAVTDRPDAVSVAVDRK